jgi:hypothetical protein
LLIRGASESLNSILTRSVELLDISLPMPTQCPTQSTAVLALIIELFNFVLREMAPLGPFEIRYRKRAKANTVPTKMTTSESRVPADRKTPDRSEDHATLGFIRSWLRVRTVRELMIFAAFCILTVLMTWPWVLHLRDAVADRGDPYMIAWTLWSDYHQTFHNPFHLFDANIFYPYRYTLAFSENDYGIALLLFPLFALGLRTLTIHSIATFLGFAFSGYGAFRLTRTLTESNGSAWIAGIIFAFIPYRFHVLSHLHYLFAGWVPLLLEGFVLFVLRPSWRRASWFGIAFFMNALSCISWFIMTLIPLGLVAALLVANSWPRLRGREFWLRGGVALLVATVALLPFLAPYYVVSIKYGLRWQPWEFAYNSPSMIHWLVSDPRNKLWQNLGANIPGGHKLFPGMLAPLLAIAALRIKSKSRVSSESPIMRYLAIALEVTIVLAAVIGVLALGYGSATYRVLGHQLLRLDWRSPGHALTVILVVVTARLLLMLPRLVRRVRRGRGVPAVKNHAEDARATIGSADRTLTASLAIGVGLIWTVWGFLSSLGANFFVNNWLHDYVLPFQSIRIPSRAAMICYVGLAVLGGIGAAQIAGWAYRYVAHPRTRAIVFALFGVALLFELHASPLRFEKGEVDPSALALRLKQTPMRGGLVELPSEEGTNRDFYMLRAADHGRPLVNATSSFISPLTNEINLATRAQISDSFLNLLEKIPASYLVIHNDRLVPELRPDYENFLARQIVRGRLRFINRFDGHSDLYAVVSTEPDAASESVLPFTVSIREWSETIHDDPVTLLSQPLSWSQRLYRVYLASTGAMPRYKPFMSDLEKIGHGIIVGSDEQEREVTDNFQRFMEEWTRRESFSASFAPLDNTQYVNRLIENAGISIDPAGREAFISRLASGHETRTGVLMEIVDDPRLIEKEQYRSLLELHYFGYLRRNPDDPPDGNLRGFNFWLQTLEHNHDTSALSTAFKVTGEYHQFERKP